MSIIYTGKRDSLKCVIKLLPPPSRWCFHSSRLFVRRITEKLHFQFWKKFIWKVAHRPYKKAVDFGGNWDHVTLWLGLRTGEAPPYSFMDRWGTTIFLYGQMRHHHTPLLTGEAPPYCFMDRWGTTILRIKHVLPDICLTVTILWHQQPRGGMHWAEHHSTYSMQWRQLNISLLINVYSRFRLRRHRWVL